MNESEFKFPAELTIAQAAEVKSEILDVINNNDVIIFDDSAIERIDTLGLQLLFATVNDAAIKNKLVHWHCQSDVVKACVSKLGINDPILNRYIHG